MTCATSKNVDQTRRTDQPEHLPSLIRVFTVCMKKPRVLSYPLSAQRRLWSDWADAQPDRAFAGCKACFVRFVMLTFHHRTWWNNFLQFSCIPDMVCEIFTRHSVYKLPKRIEEEVSAGSFSFMFSLNFSPKNQRLSFFPDTCWLLAHLSL